MHAIVRLPTRKNVHDFVYGIWKTDLFRSLHKEGMEEAARYNVDGGTHNFVSKIVDDFAKLPRFSFSMTDTRVEWAHFSTWWGGIPLREYDNPYIHDLYWIHEMAHAGRMVYVRNMTFENFLRKMTDNELVASVVSEIQVYLEIPELRKLSFPHRIYADKFLEDERFMHRYKVDPEAGFQELMVLRRDTMMNPVPISVVDFWIHRFYMQNAAWGACWAQSFNKVETAMTIFRDNVMSDNRVGNLTFNQDTRRAFALDTLIGSFLGDNTTDNVPFRREAEAFAGVYWANRSHYDDAMKTNTK